MSKEDLTFKACDRMVRDFEDVIKKPVREPSSVYYTGVDPVSYTHLILINTPAAFGAMGATTNLFPSMILGGLSAGLGITSDNVSPMNLVYMRNAAWGVREVSELEGFDESGTGRTEAALDVTGLLKTILRQLED